MSKFSHVIRDELNPDAPNYVFVCPGCKRSHGVWTDHARPIAGPTWDFNGDVNRPTITPSLLVKHTNKKGKDVRCHLLITDGIIQFLPDSSHALAGKSAQIPEFSIEAGSQE